MDKLRKSTVVQWLTAYHWAKNNPNVSVAELAKQHGLSLSGAENDLKALTKIREYFNKRIADCEKFIEESANNQEKRSTP